MARRELYGAILELLAERAYAGQDLMSRADIATALGAPPATVLRYIDKLIGDGKLERIGATSAARYRLLWRTIPHAVPVVIAQDRKSVV